MNPHVQSFLFPQDHVLSRQFLTLWPRRLPNPLYGENQQRYLFFWARNAIFWSLKALNIPPGASILAPAYICRAAIEPMAAYGVKVDYYNVTRNCEADLSDLEARIHDRTRAVMVVHYFGFPQQIHALRNVCDRHGLFLIEDCAHVLWGEINGRSLGTFGEASIFSWRKHLPVYDGGELVLNDTSFTLDIRWSKESMLLTLKIAKNLLESALHPTRQPGMRAFSLRRRLQSIGRAIQHGDPSAHQVLPAVYYGTSFNKDTVSLPMSRLSRQVMAHSSIEDIVSRRRANYSFLLHKLGPIEGISLPFPDLPESMCPLFFPLFVDGMPDAHLPLRCLGIPAVTWDGVRPLTVAQKDFPDADFLYRNLVLLPVHQCLREEDLATMVSKVRVVRNGDGR